MQKQPGFTRQNMKHQRNCSLHWPFESIFGVKRLSSLCEKGWYIRNGFPSLHIVVSHEGFGITFICGFSFLPIFKFFIAICYLLKLEINDRRP